MRTRSLILLLFPIAALSANARTTGYLHTRGNEIVDSGDQPVRLAGVNWYGFELTTEVALGLTQQDYKQILEGVQKNDYNAIRLPFSNQMVEHPIVPSNITYENGKNSDLRGLNSLQVLDKIVAYAGYLGLRIILDNHRSSAGDNTESAVWYTSAYPESSWISDWRTLAKRYRNSPAVIGFDLRNEPNGAGIGGSCWDCELPANDWHLAAERAGNAALAINPHLLILVEGTDCYNGDCSWWGGNLEGVRYSPVILNVPNQLVYSVHDYGPNVYKKRWFNRSTNYASLVALWTKFWAYISLNGIAPVWVGEFGTTNKSADILGSVPGSQGQWFQSLALFLETQPSVGWNYWALNGEDNYGLLGRGYDTAPANPLKQQMLAAIRGGAPWPAAIYLASAPANLSASSLLGSPGVPERVYASIAFTWPGLEALFSWWKLAYLLFAILVPTAAFTYFKRQKLVGETRNAAAIRSVTGFTLLIAFCLGAASNTKQFLVLFANGLIGAASGYLAGVWLAPGRSQARRFDQARNLVTPLLAGVAGAKLLTLWDTLTKPDTLLIFQPDYYLPFASLLAAFLIAFVAFHMLRHSAGGRVHISAPKDKFLTYELNGKTYENGLRAESAVKPLRRRRLRRRHTVSRPRRNSA